MEATDYLVAILSPLVTRPEFLVVTRTQDERGVLLTVEADKFDYGKIIGKQGETIKAVRTIINCYGMALNSKLSVKVAAPYKEKVQYGA